MGLFDNLFSSGGDKSISKQEAFFGILIAAAAADGHIAEEEAEAMTMAVSRKKLFANFSPSKLKQMSDNLCKIIQKGGPDLLVEKCAAALPEELHATVFAYACDIVLADGVVEDSEKTLIEKLRKRLGIPVDEAKEIIKVMVIKNRG